MADDQPALFDVPDRPEVDPQLRRLEAQEAALAGSFERMRVALDRYRKILRAQGKSQLEVEDEIRDLCRGAGRGE